jgi:hypothetical protein
MLDSPILRLNLRPNNAVRIADHSSDPKPLRKWNPCIRKENPRRCVEPPDAREVPHVYDGKISDSICQTLHAGFGEDRERKLRSEPFMMRLSRNDLR